MINVIIHPAPWRWRCVDEAGSKVELRVGGGQRNVIVSHRPGTELVLTIIARRGARTASEANDRVRFARLAARGEEQACKRRLRREWPPLHTTCSAFAPKSMVEHIFPRCASRGVALEKGHEERS
jgi:hypothetical protein